MPTFEFEHGGILLYVDAFLPSDVADRYFSEKVYLKCPRKNDSRSRCSSYFRASKTSQFCSISCCKTKQFYAFFGIL